MDTAKGFANSSQSTTSDPLAVVAKLTTEHEFDLNFPVDLLERAQALQHVDPTATSDKQLRDFMHVIQSEREVQLDHSPYLEVQAVVESTDNPDTPAGTFRAWLLGLLFAVIGAGLDQFFSLRQPGIYVTSLLAQLLAYPCGIFLAWALPTSSWRLFGASLSLNPGPFNQKEHILITVMSNVSYGGLNGTAYVVSIFQCLRLDMFYGAHRLADSAGFQTVLVISTQLIGYGCAGLLRRFLVYPPSMVWPKNLATIALNRALHHDNAFGAANGWQVSRFRFFLYCFAGMFVYFWFPGYIFQALAYFNWISWISPTNITLAIITGSVSGLGLNPWTTFDWNTLSLLFDPISTPFFSILNNYFGMLIFSFAVIAPIYFTNVWNTSYFPINSTGVFDNKGNSYNVTRVLNADFSLNETAYEEYSPAYLSAAYAVAYSSFFAIYLAAVVHVLLYNRKEILVAVKSIWQGKRGNVDFDDVHNRLMRKYKEVPEVWYATVLAIAFIMGLICVTVYDTGLPAWGVVIGLLMCVVLQIPTGVIQATTNVEVTQNVLAEFIGSYAVPNKPIANMIFKAYGYATCAQSIQFAADLKLGHYLKVAPRTMFFAQTVATIVSSVVSVAGNAWQLAHIQDVCQIDQANHFRCPGQHLNLV